MPLQLTRTQQPGRHLPPHGFASPRGRPGHWGICVLGRSRLWCPLMPQGSSNLSLNCVPRVREPQVWARGVGFGGRRPGGAVQARGRCNHKVLAGLQL